MAKYSHDTEIKLIVSDVDGTLVDTKKHVSKRTVDAVTKAQVEGCEVAIASGRTFSEMVEIQNKIPAISYFICSNGAYVYDGHKDKVLFSTGLTTIEALQLLKGLATFDVFVEVYLAGKVYSEKKILPRFNEFINKSLHELFLQSRIYLDDLCGFIEKENKPIEKIQVFYGSMGKKEAILACYKEAENFYVIVSSEGNLEFVPKGVSKGVAVQKLAEQRRFTADNVMTIGDSNNDLTMLAYAGLSFGMASGMETAKETAKFVAPTNDEDGVAQVIEWVLENNKRLKAK